MRGNSWKAHPHHLEHAQTRNHWCKCFWSPSFSSMFQFMGKLVKELHEAWLQANCSTTKGGYSLLFFNLEHTKKLIGERNFYKLGVIEDNFFTAIVHFVHKFLVSLYTHYPPFCLLVLEYLWINCMIVLCQIAYNHSNKFGVSLLFASGQAKPIFRISC